MPVTNMAASIWEVLAVQLRYWRKNMSKVCVARIPGAGYGSGVDDGSGKSARIHHGR